jgi:hypothetical protein
MTAHDLSTAIAALATMDPTPAPGAGAGAALRSGSSTQPIPIRQSPPGDGGPLEEPQGRGLEQALKHPTLPSRVVHVHGAYCPPPFTMPYPHHSPVHLARVRCACGFAPCPSIQPDGRRDGGHAPARSRQGRWWGQLGGRGNSQSPAHQHSNGGRHGEPSCLDCPRRQSRLPTTPPLLHLLTLLLFVRTRLL